MKEPTGIVDKFLYPIEVAAQAHRGIRTAGKYQWMADLKPTDLNLLIEELHVETERVLTQFFLEHRIEIFESFELWLADRSQKEQTDVHPTDKVKSKKLA